MHQDSSLKLIYQAPANYLCSTSSPCFLCWWCAVQWPAFHVPYNSLYSTIHTNCHIDINDMHNAIYKGCMTDESAEHVGMCHYFTSCWMWTENFSILVLGLWRSEARNSWAGFQQAYDLYWQNNFETLAVNHENNQQATQDCFAVKEMLVLKESNKQLDFQTTCLMVCHSGWKATNLTEHCKWHYSDAPCQQHQW